MFVLVLSLLVLHCAIASPVDEPEAIEYREWIPSRAVYARDFDHWFDWVPWASNEGKRSLSVKERIQSLENRQKALFDLVRCESYGNECSLLRTQAETIFEVPSKESEPTAPTKNVSTGTPVGSTVTPAENSTPQGTPTTVAGTTQ